MKLRRGVLGAFERLSFPEFGVDSVVTKVDTGAYSGAVHATYIKELKDSSGAKSLRFNFLGKKDKRITKHEYHVRRVRSSNGKAELRYSIDTTVTINGKSYPLEITLTNRQSMTKPVLLGRKFLRTHNFLVDVRKSGAYRTQKKD